MMQEYIWVHRRHADHPEVRIGFRYVDPEVARQMIADGCAQNKGTDQKRLKFTTDEVFDSKKKTKVSKPAPTLEAPPEPILDPVVESPPEEAPKPKRRTYKRRDVTAEK